jgi:hypothetical protein
MSPKSRRFQKVLLNQCVKNLSVRGPVSLLDLLVLILCMAASSLPVWAASTVTFTGSDKATQGNWIGVYGLDGSAVANGPEYPAHGNLSYGTFAILTQQSWTWASNIGDKRAPEIDGQGDRIAAAWYAGSFSVDVNFTDGKGHQVALYVLDWDGQGRAETIQVTDATSPNNPALLDTRNIPSSNTNTVATDFANGTYLIWTISGHVTITLTANAGPNAVVSGVFFGGSSVAPPTASAANFHFDTTTQGNWLGTYGADGFSVADSQQSLPSYDPAFVVQSQNYIWNANPGAGAINALETGTSGQSLRIASTWDTPGSFSFDLNLADGQPHSVALYALDWDNRGRAETVTIQNATSGATLDTESISSFTNGTYLIWTITGHVTVTVAGTAGPNAVISGVFFGGAGVPVPAATAAWIGADTTTQGAWIGKYGSQGYSLAHGAQNFLIPATLTVEHSPPPWLWANNPIPPDPRDLETDTQGHQIAAAWYSSGSCTFSLDLNLTDGQLHQVAIYVLDWDNIARAETVEISDANLGNTLDIHKIPSTGTSTNSANFVAGTYLVWNVSGHVRIDVTSNGYSANAVAGGVFFDAHH